VISFLLERVAPQSQNASPQVFRTLLRFLWILPNGTAESVLLSSGSSSSSLLPVARQTPQSPTPHSKPDQDVFFSPECRLGVHFRATPLFFWEVIAFPEGDLLAGEFPALSFSGPATRLFFRFSSMKILVSVFSLTFLSGPLLGRRSPVSFSSNRDASLLCGALRFNSGQPSFSFFVF